MIQKKNILHIKELENRIENWLNILEKHEVIPIGVKYLNFGFQKTHNEYELYLSGHGSYSEDHDTWLLDEIYSPQSNFVGLGADSLSVSVDEFKTFYRQKLIELLSFGKIKFITQVEFICISYVLGRPEKIIQIIDTKKTYRKTDD